MPESSTQPDVVVLLRREIERVLESPQNSTTENRRRMSRPSHRASRVAVVAAGCAIVLLAAGAIIRQSDRTPGVEVALADVARKIELAPQPRADQFVYTKSRVMRMESRLAGIDSLGRPSGEFLSSRVASNESWISTKRKGRLEWQYDEPTYPTAQDSEIGGRFWRAIDEFKAIQSDPARRDERRQVNRRILRYERERGTMGMVMPASTERATGAMMPGGGIFIGGETIPSAKIDEYPRDPEEIYRRIRTGAERTVEGMREFAEQHPDQAELAATDPDLEVWRTLTNPSGAQEQPVPADLRAALLKSLALLPGVKSAGRRTDSSGRQGQAFEWNHDGVRETVIYDEETAVLLSATSVLTDPSAYRIKAFHRVVPGTRIYEYELIEQRTLDELPEQ